MALLLAITLGWFPGSLQDTCFSKTQQENGMASLGARGRGMVVRVTLIDGSGGRIALGENGRPG
jgi:hypothetical protein